jgi:uncharacterized OsmC-like protein
MEVTVERIAGRRFAVNARGLEVVVDDTVENGGPGDGFRPTELVMGGLGACMMGTMINFARNQGITIGDVQVSLHDEVAEHPERMGVINITMVVETDATERQLASLERVASACKVHNTLERSPEIKLDFRGTALV